MHVYRVLFYISILLFSVITEAASYAENKPIFNQLTAAKTFSAAGQAPVKLTSETRKIDLAKYTMYLEDDRNHYGLKQVLQKYQGNFSHYPQKEVAQNFGLRDSAFWHRIVLENTDVEAIDVVLEVQNPLVDYIELILLEQGGYTVKQSGNLVDRAERDIDSNFVAFQVILEPLETKTIFIKAHTHNASYFPFVAYTGYGFSWSLLERLVISGIFMGVIIGLLAYNTCLYLYTRQILHFYFTLLCLATLLLTSVQQNYFYFIDGLDVADQLKNTTCWLVWTLAFNQFVRCYLDTKTHYPTIDRILMYLNVYTGVFIVCGLSGLSNRLFMLLYAVPALGIALIYFGLSIHRYRKGSNPALFILIGMLIPVSAGILRAMILHGFINANEFLNLISRNFYAPQIMVLSIGLVSLVKELSDRKLEKDKEVISVSIANNLKSQFLNRMSFQIRTPLNGVIGAADVLSNSDLQPEQQKFTNVIRRSGHSLLTIVDDVVDFSKGEGYLPDLELKPINLIEHAKDCIGVLETMSEDKNIEFIIEMDTHSPADVMGDANRLRQIILNLLSNAYKFTDEGSITLKVMCIDRSDDRAVGEYKFSVIDTGIGISSQNQGKLFSAYEQATTSVAREYGGTGLGLVIIKKLSHLMGGTVGFTSEEGKGSTFWFTAKLPFVRSPGVSLSEKNSQSLKEFNKVRALVVDDDAICQQALESVLELLGVDVTVVSSGYLALEVFEQKRIDIIFMDCVMPRQSGFETTSKIRQFEELHQMESVGIIAVTAKIISGERSECFSAGMDGFVSKPITIESIADEMRAVLFEKATTTKEVLEKR